MHTRMRRRVESLIQVALPLSHVTDFLSCYSVNVYLCYSLNLENDR